MATARDARDWAREAIRGIGDSLYTPFAGEAGDDIDWDAYRRLVRYCAGDLGREMLWCVSGLAEFWALTLEERKRLLEVAIDEARAVNPGIVIQACTAATAAKDCLELTRHAQEAGADIVYIQTPMMECHGGEGVLDFFRYVADRTDIALGMFNSPSSGYVLTAEESARIAEEIPAVCATKEGAFRPANSRRLHELAPELLIWECDTIVYRAGWLRDGIVCGGAAGHRRLPVRDTPAAAVHRVLEAGVGRQADRGDGPCPADRHGPVRGRRGSWYTCYPGRPEYFTHWGGAFKYAAVGAGAARRRVPGISPAAGSSAGCGQGPDPCGLSGSRAARRTDVAPCGRRYR